MSPKTAYLAVLGGNALAREPINRLRERGYRTLVIDANPCAPARELSDAFLNVDFFRPDETIEALRPFEICAVMALNDFGVRTAARISAERGLPGNPLDAAWRATNKAAMKAAWAAAGLPTPKHTTIYKCELIAGVAPQWDTYPCIVKPAFSGGGSRAVALVHSPAELRAFVAENIGSFLDDEVIVEEFVSGSEHTVEVLLWDGNARVLSVSDKENYPGSATVVQNLYFPGPVGNAHREAIEALVIDACRRLGLRCGAAHFEVLLRDGKPLLLEVGARPGGGINLCPICELSTGYDYPSLYAAVLCGRAPDFARAASTWHLAWHYFSAGQGQVTAVHGIEDVASAADVVDVQIYERVGQARMDLKNDLARPGYVLVRGHSHAQARSRARELCAMVRIESSACSQPAS
jgi:biotin carboxylase